GLKAQYAKHVFADKENTSQGMIQHKVTLEAVYNIGEVFNFNYKFYENFALLMHAGVGFSTLNPKGLTEYSYVANIQGGLTPLIRLSDKMALYLDGTLVVNVGQEYSYNGQPISSALGIFPTANAGLVFYIGDRRYHADWF